MKTKQGAQIRERTHKDCEQLITDFSQVVLTVPDTNIYDFEVYKMVFNGVRLEPTLIQD